MFEVICGSFQTLAGHIPNLDKVRVFPVEGFGENRNLGWEWGGMKFCIQDGNAKKSGGFRLNYSFIGEIKNACLYGVCLCKGTPVTVTYVKMLAPVRYLEF